MPVGELTSVQGQALNVALRAAAEPTAIERSDTHSAAIVSFVGTAVTGIGAEFVTDQRDGAGRTSSTRPGS